MGSYHSLEHLPDDVFDDLPFEVKRAFHSRARAGAALRLYRRRGWNDSAVRVQLARASESLERAISEWEHRELNPKLF